MKKLTIIALILSVFIIACGDSQSDPPIWWPPPVVDPPSNTNTVGFSCASVDNDQICSGIKDEPGIWNSGEVFISLISIPIFYLNLDVTNNMVTNATIFMHAIVTTPSICSENQVIFDMVELVPGESASFHYGFNDILCGLPPYHEAVISVYNASDFNPADYPDPWLYPRTDLIANAVVMWENRLLMHIADMP